MGCAGRGDRPRLRLPGSPELRRRIWRIVRIAVGSTLLFFGIIGLVLPVLQGFALILAGLAVLATELPWARRWLHRVRDWIRALRRKLRRRDERETEESDAQGGGQAG